MINKQNKAIKCNIFFAVNYSFIFNFLALSYMRLYAKFMIVIVLKFPTVCLMYVHKTV